MTSARSDAKTQFTAKGADTRQRIIAVAAELIGKSSADRVTIDDILAESQTSKSQFYHYFQDKEGLLLEVIGHQAKCVIAVQAPHIEALSSMAAFRLWRNAIVAFNRENGAEGCPLGSLAYELSSSSEASRRRLEEGFGVWRRKIESGLVAMRKNGELSPSADPEALAVAILAALQGGFLLSRLQGDVSALETAFDMALAHLERHLAK